MPTIHNPDWNSLKLSDFPQFKCLCELCDCGLVQIISFNHLINYQNRNLLLKY